MKQKLLHVLINQTLRLHQHVFYRLQINTAPLQLHLKICHLILGTLVFLPVDVIFPVGRQVVVDD